MALTDITTKIAEDAEKEAQAILKEAEDRVQEIEASSSKAVATFEKEAASLRAKATEKASEQVLAGARHHASFTQAEFRNRHIQNVFESVSKKLSNLPDSDYQTFMKKLLQEVPKGATYTIAHEKEEVTKKVLKEMGVDSKSINTAPQGELLGGCIATTDENEFDFSFSGMLSALEKSKRSYAAQELFN